MARSSERFDRIIKWVSLGAIPPLLLLGYLARGSDTADTEPSAQAPSNIDATGLPSGSAEALGSEPTPGVQVVDESWPPKQAAPPKQQPAVDLPIAETPGPKRATAGAAPRGPCGGLVVKLITRDDDGATASISADLHSRAEVKQVGDRVGNYRVSRIEWDRVWFSSGGGLCSVGIHHGARAAFEAAPGGVMELVDGGSPGAPSPDPVVPDPGVTAGGVPLELAEGIRTDSPLSVSVEGFAVKTLKSRGKALLAKLQLTDLRELRGQKGVRISGVKPESLLERLGFADQDVLLAIDDDPISSRERLLEWLEAWLSEEPKEAHTYRVVLERMSEAGEPERVTLELTLGL